jgi:hypothetical protein
VADIYRRLTIAAAQSLPIRELQIVKSAMMMVIAKSRLKPHAYCTVPVFEQVIVDLIEATNHDQKQKPNRFMS